MGLEMRQPVESERDAVLIMGNAGFNTAVDTLDDDAHLNYEWDRTFCWFEDASGRPVPVGMAAAHTMQLTMPGGTAVPAGGLASVSVQPTHRRRGLLTALMEAHVDDCLARGEVATMLTASETGIYDRFGYGWAMHHRRLSIDTTRGAYRADLSPEAAGALEGATTRMITRSEMSQQCPPIFEAMRLARNGGIDRPTEDWWRSVLHKKENWKGGGALFCAVYTSPAGVDEGYVLYVIDDVNSHNHMTNVLRIKELVATTDTADAALWRHCLDRDLTAKVIYPLAPVDSPIRWRLAEPRWLRISDVDDALWVRPLDIEAFLGARAWSAAGEVTIEVTDQVRPTIGGRFSIEAAAPGEPGQVQRSTAEPDLTMGVDVLGSLSTGGMSAIALHRAGRIEGTPDAAARAEALFTTTPAPWMITRF